MATGAGRKKKVGAVSRDARPEFSARYPQHVTLRTVQGAPNLAAEWLQPHIRELHKPHFRIVEYNVLDNQLHLVVEAANKRARARGMQRFEVRLATRSSLAAHEPFIGARHAKWRATSVLEITQGVLVS